MLLSICICSISLFLPQTQEDHKEESAGSHLSVCSPASSQSLNNVLRLLVPHWEGRGRGRMQVSGLNSPRSPWTAGPFPGGKLLSKERNSHFPGTATFQTSYPNSLKTSSGKSACQSRGRDPRRTSSFLNCKDHTPSSLFIIILRDPHATESFVIPVPFAQKRYLLTRVFSNVANHQIAPFHFLNFSPTFQYRLSLTSLPRWLLFYIVVTSPGVRYYAIKHFPSEMAELPTLPHKIHNQ